MGIPNLLKFLKPFIDPIHINKYSGKRVGIDAYSWLHKGAYSCSMELCLNRKGESSKKYLKYFMHRINLLRHYKVIPVVVFDGGNIPCKSATESERQRRREANLTLGKEKLEQGNVNAAVEYFQKAVQITPSMAHQLIQILRLENIEFLVAPYEADAQLAYLSTIDFDQGGVSAIVTEDSDLIAYGCPAIIFKMDRYGNGEEFLMDRVFDTVLDGLSFKNLDRDLFTGMCVLAGCDFLPSIQGIGTKRAYSLVSKYKSLDRVLSVLKLDKRYEVPKEYTDSFGKVLAVFHHATVYDIKTKSLKPLKPLRDEYIKYLDGNLDILGPEIEPSIATSIAEGQINPITKELFPRSPRGKKGIKISNNNNVLNYKKRDFIRVKPVEDGYISIFSTQSNTEQMNILEDSILSRKYENEAVALGKLIESPIFSEKIEESNIEKVEGVPDNNPFKKQRKIETDKGETPDSNALKSVPDDAEISVDETNPIEKSVAEGKEKNLKKSRVKNEKKDKGKNGIKDECTNENGSILKFVVRL